MDALHILNMKPQSHMQRQATTYVIEVLMQSLIWFGVTQPRQCIAHAH